MWRFGRRTLAIHLSALAVLLSGTADAQKGASSREEQLIQLIETLQNRVDTLEERLQELEGAPPPAAAPAPELEQRIETIEEKLEAQPPMEPNDFRVFWKDSLRFETVDGRFKLRIGGRLQTDYVYVDQDRDAPWWFADVQDGGQIRRARLQVSGELWENISFKWQYDFAQDGTAKFRDMYAELNDLPAVGNLRVGQFYAPSGLELSTSANDITFMEKAMISETLGLNRQLGVMLHNAALNDRLTWAIGAFRFGSSDQGVQFDDDTGWDLAARVTGLPWYEDEGRKLLHLGASYARRNPDQLVRLRARPEAHPTARFVDTGSFWADSADVYGLEAGLVYGPFSLQGEYMRTDWDSPIVGDPSFDGYYVQASYILTGEHRGYDYNVFRNPKVKNPFSTDKGGWGAWEVAARYSTIDLEEDDIYGGEEDNITIGLNWYLNNNARIMFNYVYADVDHGVWGGDMDIFQTRFQVAF